MKGELPHAKSDWFMKKKYDLLAYSLLAIPGIIFGGLGWAALSGGWTASLLQPLLPSGPQPLPGGAWHENLYQFGLEMLTRAMLLLAGMLCLLIIRQHPQADPKRHVWRHRLVSWLREPWVLGCGAIIVLLIGWLPVILTGYHAVIDHVHYWWLFDDAMISMRYGKHLAEGVGLVWNPGERVEGYTNFLWVLVMALVHIFPIPASKTSLVILLINVILSIATLPLIIRIGMLLGGKTTAVAGTLLGMVLSSNIMAWATAGAETPLLILLFLLGIWRVLHDTATQRPSPTTFLLIASLTLVRSDGLVLAGGLYGMALLLARGREERKQTMSYGALSLIIPIAHLLFRALYYGDIIPNTARLKVSNWDHRLGYGLRYTIDFIQTYGIILLFPLASPWLAYTSTSRLPVPLRTSPSLLVMVLVLYVVYVTYAGGDAFLQFRFFVPVLPLIFLLTFLVVEQWVRWVSLRVAMVMLLLITIPLLVPVVTPPLYPRAVAMGNLTIALVLKNHTPPESRVADFWAGIVFYFSERRGVDLLGKNDPYIARLPARHGDIPGHNKFDFAYSLGVLKPDYVIGTFALPITEEKENELRRLATSEAPWRSKLYFDETFRAHCLPHPLPFPTWRTIFACMW